MTITLNMDGYNNRYNLPNGDLPKLIRITPRGKFITCHSGNTYLVSATGTQNANLRIVQ